MKKVVIIGANSGIARNFIFYLKNHDVDLRLYDIQDTHLDGITTGYKKVNLLDVMDVKKIDFKCDLVYIFSGKTGTIKGFMDIDGFVDVNEKLLLVILNEIVRQNCNCRVIYPSSRLVYDGCSVGAICENSKLFPKSIYAAEKVLAENVLKIYHDVFGLQFTIFRIAIPFGKLNPKISEYGIVAKLTCQAREQHIITLYGSGESVRTFTHIIDICSVLWEGGNDVRTLNDIFNIGGVKYSIKELATFISDKYCAEITATKWPEMDAKVEVSNGWLDSAKIDDILHMKYIDITI